MEQPSALIQYLDELLPKAVSFCVKILLAAVILIVGIVIIRWITKIIKKALGKSKIDSGVASFLCNLIKYALYFVLFMLILSQFGVTASSVVAVLGSAGLTIGLALQGSLANFAGGVLILMLKPFSIGDYIVEKATNLEGTVKEISLFSTKLTTFDNKEITIPNGNLSNTSIVNLTKNAKRRVDVFISISYDSDLKKAKEVLYEMARNDALALESEPVDVFVDELGDSGVKLGVRAWAKTEDYFALLWNLRENAKATLDANGITIPFNQLDVRIKEQ